MPQSYPQCFTNSVSLTNLLSSVMRRAVQGIPSVINEIELMAGLMKASPVVMPERMPTTILNLDLVKQMDSKKRSINLLYVISPIYYIKLEKFRIFAELPGIFTVVIKKISVQ